ncbi:MAG: type IX secretion system membrane protein PorP/SprF [Saprospiraceae bacterium]|nr:type IX secretion system membrane protein PorP/SprF [Saprospiraceae bacterium]
MNRKVLYCCLLVILARIGLEGQIHLGCHFQTQRAMINPSFVGITGVESIQMNAKMQWNNFGDASDRYQTLSVLIEEPLPCTRLLDIGIKLLHDQEGKARYKTTELGFLSSITITLLKLSLSSTTSGLGRFFVWQEQPRF